MAVDFSVYFFFVFTCLFVSFLFRPEKRVYVISFFSLVSSYLISPWFPAVLIYLVLFDFLSTKVKLNNKILVILGIVLPFLVAIRFIGFEYYIFSNVKIFVGFHVIVVLLFHRIRFYLEDIRFKTIKEVLLFNLFFPKFFTPVISNFRDELSGKAEELHYEIDSFFLGIKSLALGSFVVLCLFLPGVRFLSALDVWGLEYLFLGILFTSLVFSVHEIGAGTSLIFNYRTYRNFDSPYFADNFIDFWRRWCLSFYSFCDTLLGKVSPKKSTFIISLLCIVVSSIYFGHFLNFGYLITFMFILGGGMTLVVQKVLPYKILNRNLVFKYLYKISNLVIILFIFGFSFRGDLVLLNRSDVDVGSFLIFIFSTILLVLYNFTQKRKIDLKIYFLKNKSLSLFIVFLYMVMFGDFI